MSNNNMTSLPRRLRPNNPLRTNNLPRERRLVLVSVDGDGRLIVVGGSFEEVLFFGTAEDFCTSVTEESSEGGDTSLRRWERGGGRG